MRTSHEEIKNYGTLNKHVNGYIQKVVEEPALKSKVSASRIIDTIEKSRAYEDQHAVKNNDLNSSII
jgi:response regulator RpfG family c-di-GMP phosphodiesterase